MFIVAIEEPEMMELERKIKHPQAAWTISGEHAMHIFLEQLL